MGLYPLYGLLGPYSSLEPLMEPLWSLVEPYGALWSLMKPPGASWSLLEYLQDIIFAATVEKGWSWDHALAALLELYAENDVLALGCVHNLLIENIHSSLRK